MTYLKAIYIDPPHEEDEMNWVILFCVVIGLVFGFCFFLSHRSKRQDRDLLQYLILLTLYRKGLATESDILRSLKIDMIEAGCGPVAIPKEKDIHRMLSQCLNMTFITQDDSERPFIYYQLTERGEVWVENQLGTFIPSKHSQRE